MIHLRLSFNRFEVRLEGNDSSTKITVLPTICIKVQHLLPWFCYIIINLALDTHYDCNFLWQWWVTEGYLSYLGESGLLKGGLILVWVRRGHSMAGQFLEGYAPYLRVGQGFKGAWFLGCWFQGLFSGVNLHVGGTLTFSINWLYSNPVRLNHWLAMVIKMSSTAVFFPRPLCK